MSDSVDAFKAEDLNLASTSSFIPSEHYVGVADKARLKVFSLRSTASCRELEAVGPL